MNERNIFLSRDSCSCRAKRLRTGDLFEASKRLRTGDSFGKRKIGKRKKGKKEKRKIKKLNEQNIFLSRDSCSCRAKRLRTGDLFEASKRLRTGDSFGKRKIGKRKKGKKEKRKKGKLKN